MPRKKKDPLEDFVEITPDIARAEFPWLCSKEKTETDQECADRIMSLLTANKTGGFND